MSQQGLEQVGKLDVQWALSNGESFPVRLLRVEGPDVHLGGLPYGKIQADAQHTMRLIPWGVVVDKTGTGAGSWLIPLGKCQSIQLA